MLYRIMTSNYHISVKEVLSMHIFLSISFISHKFVILLLFITLKMDYVLI